MDYNVIVIGAGSGGLVSAYIGAVLKAKVALIEKHRMGGDCLNTGCVPSKALIRTATLISHIRHHKEFGLSAVEAQFNFTDVMQRVQRVIRKIEPHDSIERYSGLGVDCIQGEAKILSPHEVRINGRVLTARSIIIAAGAAPAIPKIAGLDKINVLNTDNIWDIRELPKRLVVIGGGPIGCELGQAFVRLGSSVSIIQTAPQLLNREDDEIVKIMQERFHKDGMQIYLNAEPLEIISRNGTRVVFVHSQGKKFEIEFDQILAATGRKPQVSGYGIEELGIELSPAGAIKTDAYGRTNIKNIFACGDVTSPYQFTHMAAHQAWYCAVNALLAPLKKFKVDLSIVPWCTYTDPEIGRVGLNEKQAREKGIAYEVTVYPLEELDRAITDGEGHGMIKILTVPGKDKILGVTICGHHAGDLLPEFVFAKKYGHGLNDILNTIHVYPTMAEANKYAAGAWKKAHAPQRLLNLMEKFHKFWRGG